MFRVRPSKIGGKTPLTTMLPSIVVWPGPIILPPWQVMVPVTVRVAKPEMIPPSRVRFVSVVSVKKFTVPEATVRLAASIAPSSLITPLV